MFRRSAFLFATAIFFLLAFASRLLADGVFYVPEGVPPKIPYQRALVVYDKGEETLIVQSKFEQEGDVQNKVGWVIPVPSVPDLASLSPEHAFRLFWRLNRESQPRTVAVVPALIIVGTVGVWLAWLTFSALAFSKSFKERHPWIVKFRKATGAITFSSLIAIALFLFCFLSPFAGGVASPVLFFFVSIILFPLRFLIPFILRLGFLAPVVSIIFAGLWLFLLAYVINRIFQRISPADKNSPSMQRSRRFVRVFMMSLFFFFLYFVSLPPTLEKAGAANADDDVVVLKSEQVGVYDAHVIASKNAEDLIAWLRENGFHFDSQQKKVLDDYVRKGWCFVVAKVGEQAEEKEVIGRSGLAAPLVLKFKTAKPVYPLSLTAFAGSKTKILLYVLAPHRVSCDGRLKLRFARRIPEKHQFRDQVFTLFARERELRQQAGLPVFSEEFFRPIKHWPNRLCKFTGKLRPQDMREDLVFEKSKTQKEYREIWGRVGRTYFRLF